MENQIKDLENSRSNISQQFLGLQDENEGLLIKIDEMNKEME